MQPVSEGPSSNNSSNSSSRGIGSSKISRSSSGLGRSNCSSSGHPILLITLLIATATAAAEAGVASAATVSIVPSAAPSADETPTTSYIDNSGRLQKIQQMHAVYHEIPRLKLYKACGLPLVMLLARKCSRRGGVYLLETDPRFALMASKQRERQNATRTVTHVKVAKIKMSSRHLCFRRNYGIKNPFLDCCCNYCTERTVLGYCRLSSFSPQVSG